MTRHTPTGLGLTSPLASPSQDPVVASALAALVAGGIAIGVAPVLVRLTEVGPVTSAAYRMAFGFLAAWLYLAATRPRQAAPAAIGRRDRLLVWAAGLLFAGDIALFHTALVTTTVANATLFANLAPILAGLGGWLVLGERPSRGYLLGLLPALGGAFLLSAGAARGGTWSLEGDLIAVGSAVFYAGYILLVRHLRDRLSSGEIILGSTAAAALALAPAALLTESVLLPAGPTGWAALVVIGVIGYSLGQGLIAFGMGHLPVGFSSLVLMLQPAVATVMAWLWFGETLSAIQALGAALIIAAIVLARPRAAVVPTGEA